MFSFLRHKTEYISRLAKVYRPEQALIVVGWLCQKASGYSLAELLASPGRFTLAHEFAVEAFVAQIVDEHYPLQYILGEVSFGPLHIVVEPPVLIPRPETEEWVMNALKAQEHYKSEPLAILDLCTGSGCIALACAQFFKNATIDAVDLYEKPLEMVKKNMERNSLTSVTPVQSDLFENLQGKTYDLIFANPPYIDENVWKELSPTVKDWEDKQALVADHKGLALYEKIIPLLPEFLKVDSIITDKPRFYTEIGYDQGKAVERLLTKTGLKKVSVIQDFQGHDRVVSAEYSFKNK